MLTKTDFPLQVSQWSELGGVPSELKTGKTLRKNHKEPKNTLKSPKTTLKNTLKKHS